MQNQDRIIRKVDSGDIFVAGFPDSPAKGHVDFMEHPLFSLSKQPDFEVFRYHNKKQGIWLEVAPSLFGRANIFDKDILLYSGGQLVEGMNRGEQPSQNIRIVAHEYLVSTERDTNGREYKRLHEALARLRGTTFKTNLYGDNGRQVFGLIDEAEIACDTRGRMTYIDITLSRLLFAAIKEQRILTYHRDYFTLSPSERRAYELVRKHCGHQAAWKIGLEQLWTKFGGRSSMPGFRRLIKRIVNQNRLPQYKLELDTMREMLVARRAGE